MVVDFANHHLENLYRNADGADRLPTAVVSAFLRRVRALEAAANEEDLRVQASLRFRPFRRGRTKGKHILHLADGWQILVELRGQGPDTTATIHDFLDLNGESIHAQHTSPTTSSG